MDILECVHITFPQDDGLLTRFYNELMIPNFPLQEELEPLERWREALLENNRNSPSDPKGGCYTNVSVAFDANDKAHKTLIGGIVYEYYYPSNCCLISYLVTNPLVRGQGSGVFLGLHAWQVMRNLALKHGHKQPHIIFCEVNDPQRISASDDSVSPLQRLRAFQQMGVRQMHDFYYVQPALEGRKERARDMLLAVVVGPMTPRDEKTGSYFVRAEHVEAFFRDFYRELNVNDVDNDNDFKLSMLSLRSKEEGKVKLVDFDLSKFKKAPTTKKKKDENKDAQSSSSSSAAVSSSSAAATIPIHIVVIGAGLSGLGCARDLIAGGVGRVTVLEGRNRTGGRVYTGRSFDTRVDHGAAWLHGLDGNALADFLLDNIKDIKMYKSDDQAVVLYGPDGKPIPKEQVFETYMKFLQIMQALAGSFNTAGKETETPETKQGDDETQVESEYEQWKRTQPAVCETLQAALDRLYATSPQFKLTSPTEKVIVNYFFSQIESLQAASMTQLNARDYDHGVTYDGGDNVIISGFQNIVRLLAKDVNVRLGERAVRIEWDASAAATGIKTTADKLPQIKVFTDIAGATAYVCNGVVMTASIGVLQRASLEYKPALPDWKTQAIGNIGAGLFNKVILRFEKQFWDKDDYIGFNFPPSQQQKQPTWASNGTSIDDLSSIHSNRSNTWFINWEPVVGVPILIAALSGPFATTMESATDNDITAEIMRRLRLMYGADIPAPVDVQITRWGQDPFSLCSYSHLKAGGSIRDIEAASQPVAGQIFFAGEHTSTNRFGYADGAYVSGQREAKRILKQYEHLRQLKSKL